MPAKIMDGKKLADSILESAKREVASLGRRPCLAIVLVGDDPASLVYTKKKEDACRRVGIESRMVRLPEYASEDDIAYQVRRLNADAGVDGILVQVPLPRHVDEDRVLSEVAPQKDVDGFNPENFGRTALGLGDITPCTPKGILRLLKEYGSELSGKHAVVVGRSRIVGRPLAFLLIAENCTVSVCHSRTRNLADYTRQADILCLAAGRAGLITGSMIKPGAVVVDAGTTRENGRLTGDAVFSEAKEKASLITPVPGGVGPMTVAMLIENTLICHKKRARK